VNPVFEPVKQQSEPQVATSGKPMDIDGPNVMEVVQTGSAGALCIDQNEPRIRRTRATVASGAVRAENCILSDVGKPRCVKQVITKKGRNYVPIPVDSNGGFSKGRSTNNSKKTPTHSFYSNDIGELFEEVTNSGLIRDANG